MAGQLEITFLGTGTSVGIPVIGCDCAVCTSADPRNQRTRSSILVRTHDATILVDTGPDLRQQALREDLRAIDAVIYTHAHVDHVVGFDELRAFCWHREHPLPLHATPGCMDTLKQMFGWAFSGPHRPGYVHPSPRLIEGSFHYGDLKITPLPVRHASVETVGFLFEYPHAERVAYIPDVKTIPDATKRLLENIDVLILDALRLVPHPTHMSLSESLETLAELKAQRAWFTHVSHSCEHATIEESLPDQVRMAYDGLRLFF